jgi:hypothetical protein
MDTGLQQQLTDMGIAPWLVSLDPTSVSLPDTTYALLGDDGESEAVSQGFLASTTLVSKSGLFLFVAASYPEVEIALDAETQLASIFTSVRGETALVDGKIFHRVLVGPISFDEIDSTRSTLVAQGFENAWLVNGVVGDTIGDTNANIQSSVRRSQKDDSIIVKAIKIPKKHSNPSGFNLARLPEKNPEFKP